MANTLKEIAVALSQKQEHFVDYLTNESPILDNMRFEPSTHGLWNAYEEVSKIDGAGFVDINQPLPEMEVDSSLKKIDLSILGGEIFVPEDKAAVIAPLRRRKRQGRVGRRYRQLLLHGGGALYSRRGYRPLFGEEYYETRYFGFHAD